MKWNSTNRWMLAVALAGLALGPVAAGATSHNAAPQANAASRPEPGQLKNSDYNFVVKAARIDMDEVRLGELAQKKSTNPAVRDFAERMITDHSKLNTRLQELAASNNATMPSQLSHHENSQYQHLESLSGPKFDKAYARDMLNGHEHAIKEFKSAAKNLSNPQLRTWADTTVPALQEHLRLAKNLEQTVKSEK